MVKQGRKVEKQSMTQDNIESIYIKVKYNPFLRRLHYYISLPFISIFFFNNYYSRKAHTLVREGEKVYRDITKKTLQLINTFNIAS